MSSRHTPKRKTFELWLPFTARSIGLAEQDLPLIHNLPIKQAIAAVNAENTWSCRVMYFTEQSKPFDRQDNGVPHSFFPVSFLKRQHAQTFGRQWSNSAFRHLLFDPPELVGFYGGSGRFTWTMARLCRMRNIPYYIHLGGWHVPSTPTQRRCLREANAVITFTKRQQEWMARERIHNGTNTRTWRIGVDTELFCPASTQNISTRGPRLLYVGRLVHNKGALEAVQAFRAIVRRFPDAVLDVVAPISDNTYYRLVESYIEDYALQGCVRLHNGIAYTDLPERYRSADLFILPSPMESFGFVLIESMGCGTPVVALKNSGGPEEIITDQVDGILTDLPNLAQETIALLEDPARLDEMRIHAVAKVHSTYTVENTAKELLRILNDCYLSASKYQD